MIRRIADSQSLIHIEAPRGLSRLARRPVRDGIWCRLAENARVTLYSGDLSVKVSVDGGEIRSAHDGSISFTRTSDGREFSTRTAPLYLAAAERQGIEVQVAGGYGYYR